MCMDNLEAEFMELACGAPAVVCCRCSPTQKADVVRLISLYTGVRTCAIGDGGNDVSMIQAADVGVGIVGKVCRGNSYDHALLRHRGCRLRCRQNLILRFRVLQEGKQASLAADFSITKFKHVARLFCMLLSEPC